MFNYMYFISDAQGTMLLAADDIMQSVAAAVVARAPTESLVFTYMSKTHTCTHVHMQ